jgi:hypothetical protein
LIIYYYSISREYYFLDRQDDPVIKAVTDVGKSVIMTEMDFLSVQYNVQLDFAKIISRTDAFEEKISSSPDRMSS